MQDASFRRLMTGAGVRPLGAVKPSKPQQRPQPKPPVQAAPQHKPAAWKMGYEARRVIDEAYTKLGKIVRDPRSRVSMFATDSSGAFRYLKLDGLGAGVDGLIAYAEEMECELAVIAGPGWKVILHPIAGSAVLLDDPNWDSIPD